MGDSNFNERIKAFEELLDTVIIENISTEIYCRKYLAHLLQHKKYYLTIYADVLEKLISHADKRIADIILIDFGAGNGLLGIFAKFCGFKKVFINDIEERFVAASQVLALQMNIHMDGYIRGGINEVQLFFKNEIPDAIIGTDVIEHIYSLEDFFSTLKQINPSIISVFTTASNPRNFFKVRKLKKLQVKDEYEGGTPEDFTLFGDKPLEPFFKIRQQIIQAKLENVDDKTILKLTEATRGMNQQDILEVTDQYKANKTIPSGPSHPTNTCNPLNSSWTERILTLDEYFIIYNSQGMNLEIYNGFYNEYKKGPGKTLNKILNKAIHSLGMRLAPYIIFVGTKN